METSSLVKRLAGNDLKTRHRAVNKLRTYIAVKAAKTGFSETDNLKLCKGLHYALWMQDKPLLQEELSAKFCGLLHAFPEPESALQFASAFFTTQANEWACLDQWRMDKFLMLIRDFLNATFQVLKRNQWEATLVSRVSALIGDVMDAGKEANPDGLRLHLADIYLEELAKVGAGEVKGDVTQVLLEPFLHHIVHSKRDAIADRVSQSVFSTVLGEDGMSKLEFNYRALQQSLFDAGRQKDVLPRVRRKVYKLVKRLSKSGHRRELPQPLVESERDVKVLGKRKKAGQEKEEPEKKKRATPEAEPETPTHHKTQTTQKDTPRSTPKRVVFNLERNSAQGLQDFVMSATSSLSPYLPSRSPIRGILKDSPGAGTTLSSEKTSHLRKVDTPKGTASHKQGKYWVEPPALLFWGKKSVSKKTKKERKMKRRLLR